MKFTKISKKKAVTDRSFLSMFNGNGLDDPLEELVGNGEPTIDVANHEVSEILKNLKKERKNRLERFREQLSPNFYVVVCFQSEKQKNEFVASAGWQNEEGSLYYDGVAIAEKLEISLTPVKLERRIGGKITKKVRRMEVIKHA